MQNVHVKRYLNKQLSETLVRLLSSTWIKVPAKVFPQTLHVVRFDLLKKRLRNFIYMFNSLGYLKNFVEKMGEKRGNKRMLLNVFVYGKFCRMAFGTQGTIPISHRQTLF
jgi:hypothetical protein